jgi:hypothetical protein
MPLKNLAFFISPHGFGHAARACAVMTILARAEPDIHFSLYTKVPRWFFEQSFLGSVSFSYHDLISDVGFIQTTSMQEDCNATIRALSELYPLRKNVVADLGEALIRNKTRAVLCDISVLGLAAAQYAGIPSVLIENFTWDWIYSGYTDVEPRLATFMEYLKPLYAAATVRIQAEPVGIPFEGALKVSPLARPTRSTPTATREVLRIPPSAPMILCTMGGVPGQFSFIEALKSAENTYFVLAGTEHTGTLPDNVRTIPHASSLYHPDLVAAADAVVGKVGYSTVAEAFYGRTQFFYLPRPRFPESKVMEDFVRRELAGEPLDLNSFEEGSWASTLPQRLKTLSTQAAGTEHRDTMLVRAIRDAVIA